MTRLQRDKELDYAAWSRRLLRLTWVFALLALLTELLVYAANELEGTVANRLDYLWRYVALPTAASLLIMGALSVASHYLLRQGRVSAQVYLYVAGLVVMAYMLCWMHASVAVLQALFLLPLLAALTYVDQKLLTFAAWASLAGYVLFAIFIRWYAVYNDVEVPGTTSIIITAALILITQWLCGTVLRHQQLLAENARQSRPPARKDSLTGLLDHACFYEELDARICRVNEAETTLCLVLLDIDNFKTINDGMGHAVGDEVIVALANAIGHCAGGEDRAFRYGGEEFTVLSFQGPTSCLEMTEDIRQHFMEAVHALPHGIHVTVSAGVVHYSTRRFGAKREFFAAAGEALYYAKRHGKDRAVLWHENLR